MLNDFVIIDADRHLMEPADLWIRRIDAKYRDRAPSLITDCTATALVDGVRNNGGTRYNGQLNFNRRDDIEVEYVDAICRAYNDRLHEKMIPFVAEECSDNIAWGSCYPHPRLADFPGELDPLVANSALSSEAKRKIL